jgi:hypothetical protein
MIVHSPYSDDVRESRLDAAISRGYDPHEHDDVVAPRPLDGEWLAAFDASVAEAKALIEARAAS